MKVITDYKASIIPRLAPNDLLKMSDEELEKWLEEYRGKRLNLQQGKEKIAKAPKEPKAPKEVKSKSKSVSADDVEF